MWIIATTGFYSVMRKPGDEQLVIRSRVRKDLVDLKKRYLPSLGKIIDTDNSDYRFRAYADASAVGAALAKIAEDIDYSNFKDEVKHLQGQQRATVYMRIWTALLSLQPLRGKKAQQIIVDDPWR